MCLAYFASIYLIEDVYETQVSMYVAPNPEEANQTTAMNELNYAKAVVDTYIEILRTNSFMADVAETVGLDYTPDQLRDMISMQSQNGTAIFQVAVSSNDPDEAFLISNTIAELAPEKIIDITGAAAVKVVDPAIKPEDPTTSNVGRNTLAGFVLGVVAGVFIAFILEFSDKRIKNEEDLERNYQIPLLGSIPSNE